MRLSSRPIARVLEDLPRPEDALRELKAREPELLLGGQALGVGLEVSSEVRPADLASGKRQVRIAPPAVRGHNPLVALEQPLGVIFVAICCDVEEGMAVGEHAPQRALEPFSRQPVSSMFRLPFSRTRASRSS